MNECSHRIAVAAAREPADLVLFGGKIVNVFTGEIHQADIAITNANIAAIGTGYKGLKEINVTGKILAPGFIDSHVHLESSMSSPEQFSRAVVPKGTTTVIADPHEIANVCGLAGIEYILDASKPLPLDVFIMLPSCVPATSFENAGAVLDARELEKLIHHPRVIGLGEMMDYPAVINAAPSVMEKIALARKAGKIIDGHAPRITGNDLNAYLTARISTDHECETADEMKEKLRLGMYILIREGSAARNLQALIQALTPENLRRCLFCTDDRHPGDILNVGHIDNNIRLAVASGIDLASAVRMATLNAAECYGLRDRGALGPGYKADIVIFNNENDLNIEKVIKDGKLVAETGKELFTPTLHRDERVLSTVRIQHFSKEKLCLPLNANGSTTKVRVIKVIPGSLITQMKEREVTVNNGEFLASPNQDILKLAVVERHKNTGNVGLGLVEGFGLKGGALASTVAHDSHNLILLGDSDKAMYLAAQKAKQIGGGLVVVEGEEVIESLPLPIAGLISHSSLATLAKQESVIAKAAHRLGIPENINPFMLLSFLALPVIPEIKLTDTGLFDVTAFKKIEIQDRGTR